MLFDILFIVVLFNDLLFNDDLFDNLLFNDDLFNDLLFNDDLFDDLLFDDLLFDDLLLDDLLFDDLLFNNLLFNGLLSNILLLGFIILYSLEVLVVLVSIWEFIISCVSFSVGNSSLLIIPSSTMLRIISSQIFFPFLLLLSVSIKFYTILFVFIKYVLFKC